MGIDDAPAVHPCADTSPGRRNVSRQAFVVNLPDAAIPAIPGSRKLATKNNGPWEGLPLPTPTLSPSPLITNHAFIATEWQNAATQRGGNEPDRNDLILFQIIRLARIN
jgi:hypothetical protein